MQRIVIVSKDRSFWLCAHSALKINDQFEIVLVDKLVSELDGELRDKSIDAFIVDMDATKLVELEAIQRLSQRFSGKVPILVILQRHNEAALRLLFHLQISDFITKPVAAPDLIRACLRMLRNETRSENTESRILAFMPAASGNGATTLAIQTAFILHKTARAKAKTCLVDLNLQEGTCAEYLDLDPRFKLSEVSAQPDRLDQHLLDAMLTKHPSGVSILASQGSPREIQSIDEELVLRLLDLISVSFDNVVIDLPKTWSAWMDSVLLGANETFIVAEMTVPSIRRAQRVIHAIEEIPDGRLHPKVIINRFERRRTDNGISEADVQDLIGEHFAGGVANNYKLVSEAVDRGVAVHDIDPNANVIRDLRRIIIPETELAEDERPSQGIFSFGQNLFKRRA